MSEQTIPTAIPMEAPVEATMAAESGNEGTEVHEAPKPQGAPKPKAEAKEPEWHEVKVNGQVRRYTTEQLRAKASLAEAAMEKFEKASEFAKKEAAFKEKLAKDPIAALLEQGLTADQVRQHMEGWYKKSFIDPEMMTPEQRKIQEYEAKLAKYEEQEKTTAQQAAEEQERQQMDATREAAQKEIIQMLETSGLPKNRFTVARLAFWQRQNLANGYEAPPDVLVQQVKDERAGIIRHDFKEASIEQIQDVLGEDFDAFINKVRQYDLAQWKKKQQGLGEPEDAKPTKSQNNKRTTMSDVDRYLTNLRRY